MTRNQIATAEKQHASGKRWHDGPALLIAELNGIWQGIGTREELDALKADGIFAAAVTYRDVVPSDLAWTRRITKAMLVEAGACDDQVALFAKHFPRGGVPTIAKAVAVAGLFDWDWAASALLTPAARKVYNEAIAPAWKVRDEANAASWKVYNEATAAARKVYNEATAASWKVYDEARAAAFVTAWIGQGK